MRAGECLRRPRLPGQPAQGPPLRVQARPRALQTPSTTWRARELPVVWPPRRHSAGVTAQAAHSTGGPAAPPHCATKSHRVGLNLRSQILTDLVKSTARTARNTPLVGQVQGSDRDSQSKNTGLIRAMRASPVQRACERAAARPQRRPRTRGSSSAET